MLAFFPMTDYGEAHAGELHFYPPRMLHFLLQSNVRGKPATLRRKLVMTSQYSFESIVQHFISTRESFNRSSGYEAFVCFGRVHFMLGLSAEVTHDGNRKRKYCSISGCDKKSQGARHNGMCRSHFNFKELAAQNPAADTVAVSDAARRKYCSISGCDKQSQGARNNGMCRSHFKEWAAQNPAADTVAVSDAEAGGTGRQARNGKKQVFEELQQAQQAAAAVAAPSPGHASSGRHGGRAVDVTQKEAREMMTRTTFNMYRYM